MASVYRRRHDYRPVRHKLHLLTLESPLTYTVIGLTAAAGSHAEATTAAYFLGEVEVTFADLNASTTTSAQISFNSDLSKAVLS